jgi:predicted transcriptional regulator
MVVVTVRLPGGLVAEMDALVEGSGYKYRDRSELIRQTMAEKVAAEAPVSDPLEKLMQGHGVPRREIERVLFFRDERPDLFRPEYQTVPKARKRGKTVT